MEADLMLDHPTVLNPVNTEELDKALMNCLGQLEQIEADVAAAHVDMAIHALRRQFELKAKTSIPE
ncbi:hypothetical protein ABVV53_05430 [Novosphingobium sp. RD2P27]|uniref:Uncharacterized protein n=1 Tax=Novosphingobium kalidii TaxID=3230299 RepID=A0ABV2CZ89_9SPHN